jgi:hypothetical protein
MRNISKILMCLLVGTSLASCTGSAKWMEKTDQDTVNSYIEKRINSGKYDLEGLCDRVRKVEFKVAEEPSNLTYVANARKGRRAFEQIAEKRGSDVKCPKPTAEELRAHYYHADRMRADRKKAAKSLGEAAKSFSCAAMGGCSNPSAASSSNSGRLDELERKQKEDKFWRDYNCPNDMWRKGYC